MRPPSWMIRSDSSAGLRSHRSFSASRITYSSPQISMISPTNDPFEPRRTDVTQSPFLNLGTGIRATPWFSEFRDKYGEEPNLDDPNYYYRAAWSKPVTAYHCSSDYRDVIETLKGWGVVRSISMQ